MKQKCKEFPPYTRFSNIVLSAPPRSYKAWLIKLKNIVGDLPDEQISECIETLYHLPRQLYPKRIYPVVRYRQLLIEIFEYLKKGGSLNSWCKKSGITYKTAWEILRIFGFKSVHELKNFPGKENLLLLPPQYVPWSKTPLQLRDSFVVVTISLEKKLWDRVNKTAKQQNVTPETLIKKIIGKALTK